MHKVTLTKKPATAIVTGVITFILAFTLCLFAVAEQPQIKQKHIDEIKVER